MRFLCVFSHLVAVAHRELPVKGSSAAVAQVNTLIQASAAVIAPMCL